MLKYQFDEFTIVIQIEFNNLFAFQTEECVSSLTFFTFSFSKGSLLLDSSSSLSLSSIYQCDHC